MTRMDMCRAAVVTLILGVAAAACSGSPESVPGGGGTTEPSGGSSAPVSPAPPRTSEPGPSASTSIFTEVDSGPVTLRTGATVQLRLSSRWRWEAPSVDGDSIVLVRVDYESDPGFRAWEVCAVHPGDAVIRTNGRPGPRSFRMTVHVDG
ncbi:hypothetical protein [Streptomyces sp900116325]|uniref:Secreted protein n=1 Tax=Streptomyces sp. 900116325 TaxID=3154295 RepID=A0ABV2UIJ6_9ACTN